jgi:hypothetical protein
MLLGGLYKFEINVLNKKNTFATGESHPKKANALTRQYAKKQI